MPAFLENFPSDFPIRSISGKLNFDLATDPATDPRGDT
jgi:hypothetical protein